ncbi:MAG: hypothetical protein ABII97_01440 [Patescibacteria group bacterium]
MKKREKNKTTKQRNLTDQFKVKIGRYYKIIKPLSRVLLGKSLEGKSESFIAEFSKKEPRNFFKAQIYSLPDFINNILLEPEIVLHKDEIRELLETLPLLLYKIATTKEKHYIGKIKDHPFDVFIAPKQFVQKRGREVNICRGWHIQTKRLYKHPPKRMTFNEWLNFLQSIIEKKINSVDFGFNGHLHFFNLIPLSEMGDLKKMKKICKKFYVPFNKNIDSISVSIELVNPKRETTIMTLFVYPIFKIIGCFDLDFEEVEKVYSKEWMPDKEIIRSLMLKSLKQ